MKSAIQFPATVKDTGNALMPNGDPAKRLIVVDAVGEWFQVTEPREDRHTSAERGHVLHEVCEHAVVKLCPASWRY